MHLCCWLVLFTYLFFLLSFTQKVASLPIGKLFNKDVSIEASVKSDSDNYTHWRAEVVEHPNGGPARRAKGVSMGWMDEKAIERQMRDNEHDKLVDDDGTVWYGCMSVMGKHVYYLTAEQRRERVMADRLKRQNELERVEKEQQAAQAQPTAIAVAA